MKSLCRIFIKSVSDIRFLWFTITLSALGIFYPFIHTIFLFGDNAKKVTLLSVFFLFIVCVYSQNKYRLKLPCKSFNSIYIILSVFLLVYSYLYASFTVFVMFAYAIFSWCILLLIINSVTLNYFVRAMINFNLISSLLMLIGIIFLALGKISVLSEMPLDDRTVLNYGFFFMKKMNGIEDIGIVRPAGYYDEPGSFAYVTMFLLLLNHKYYKNRVWEYGLLYLSLVTTSLAHIVTMVCYLVLFKITRSNIVKVMCWGSVILTALIIFSSIDFENITLYTIQKTTVGRVTNILEGGEDSSRSSGYNIGRQIFAKYKLGVSPETIIKEFPTFIDETFWFPIVVFGVVGVFFYYAPIVHIGLSLLKKNNVDSLKYLIILLLNFGQRPHYIFPLYIIFIYCLFYWKPSQSFIVQKK